MRLIVRMAWRNLWRNRRRSFITAASVGFAVLLAASMRAIQLGSYDNMIDNSVARYTGFIQVQAEAYWDDPGLEHTLAADDGLLARLEGQPGVLAAAPRLESFALASTGNRTRPALVLGLLPEPERRLTALGDRVVRGSGLGRGDSTAVVGQALAEDLGLEPGDTLVLLGQGYRGATAASKVAVGGIVDLPNPELNANLVALPLEAAQWIFAAEARWTAVVLAVTGNRAVPGILAELRGALPAGVVALGWRELLPELVQAIQADNVGGMIFIAVLYLVIAFGVFGTILMVTAERLYEFGVLLSVGMTRLRLCGAVLAETTLLMLLGALGGLALATPMVWFLNRYPIRFTGDMEQMIRDYGLEPILPASLDPWIPLNQAFVVLGLTWVLSLYPVIILRRLNPVRALRS